jgi:membrane protein DedA with SNARE-associated domain
MVDWKVGRWHIKNLEIFTAITLTIIYILAATIQEGTWLYNWIAGLSQMWVDLALSSTSALLMAFVFSTFGNTSVLIVFPYTFIVYLIAQHYPNWILLGIVSGIGAGIGEFTSYLVGLAIGSSKKINESELGEKFHRIRRRFEKKPGAIPWTVFLFAMTPLPDDMILVPFGIMKYPYYKTVLPCMAGKTILTTLMAILGAAIGQNAEALNIFIDANPWAFFLRLIVPSASVNPSADLIQFSMVFIVIYLIARIDFEQISKNRSKDRKHFERILNEGAIFTLQELVDKYKITNVENFKKFLDEFASRNPNLEIQPDCYQFNALADKAVCKRQSFEFIEFIFS